jgi:hypothetical protein
VPDDGQLDVGGFQIAMDDAALVRHFKGIGNLTRDGECLLDGQTSNDGLRDSRRVTLKASA